MDKTLQEKVELGLKVAEKMINEIDRNLQDAIKDENWRRVAELDAYISGMRQIEIIFSQAVG